MSRVNLNRRLVLEGAQRQPDGAGGYAVVWQPVGTVWAEVIPEQAARRGWSKRRSRRCPTASP